MRHLAALALALGLYVPVSQPVQCYGIYGQPGQFTGIRCVVNESGAPLTNRVSVCHYEPTQNVWIHEHKAKAEPGDVPANDTACPSVT